MISLKTIKLALSLICMLPYSCSALNVCSGFAIGNYNGCFVEDKNMHNGANIFFDTNSVVNPCGRLGPISCDQTYCQIHFNIDKINDQEMCTTENRFNVTVVASFGSSCTNANCYLNTKWEKNMMFLQDMNEMNGITRFTPELTKLQLTIDDNYNITEIRNTVDGASSCFYNGRVGYPQSDCLENE